MISKVLKVCYLWQNKKTVPKINLAGNYLKNAGFEIGNSVNIEISKNQIIIRNEKI